MLVLYGRPYRRGVCLGLAVAPLEQLFRHYNFTIVHPDDLIAGRIENAAR
jgi:hypothetical protein